MGIYNIFNATKLTMSVEYLVYLEQCNFLCIKELTYIYIYSTQ